MTWKLEAPFLNLDSWKFGVRNFYGREDTKFLMGYMISSNNVRCRLFVLLGEGPSTLVATLPGRKKT